MYSIQLASAGDLPEVVGIDDDATSLYASAGLSFAHLHGHPFTVDEQTRWALSVAKERLFFAINSSGVRVGFAALDVLDGTPYLDQLSVRRAAMQKGAGRFLLSHAVAWATEQLATHLWLTTYGHLAWNRPFYEREGFVVVPEEGCSLGVRHHLAAQRQALPAPEHRIAMRRTLGGS
jgi:GNAT superfamily N-acetyltransferase